MQDDSYAPQFVFFCFVFFSTVAFGGEPLKIGFVYVSPVGDAGWSYQHDLGRQAVVQRYGDRVKTRFFESIAEGPDAERVIGKLARSGFDLIFSTSFGFQNPTLSVAHRYPSLVFEQATGYKRAPNVGNYSPRFYEGRYLAGVAAGGSTRSNIIGYVAAFPIPEVVRGINAMALGALRANPKAQIRVIWTNSWFDIAKESDAADSLVAQGADVLTHHTDSVAVVKKAKDLGVHAIAYHSDMKKHGGAAQLGAVVHNWQDFYTDIVESVLEGTWQSQSIWDGIDQGMVDFVVTSEMKSDLSQLLRTTKQQIVNGQLHPFDGPIVDQDGSQVLAKGAYLSDQELLRMDYFVSNVQGRLPKR